MSFKPLITIPGKETALPAHTDTTYFSDPAGLQIFHLLHHDGQGGHTLLVDGFYAADRLKKQDAAAYDTLARLGVPAHASGSKGTMLRPPISRPVIQHDEDGDLAQIRWNNEDRGVLGQGKEWKEGDVKRWYDAARKYDAIVRSKEAELWVPLRPGTLLGEYLSSCRTLSAFGQEKTSCTAPARDHSIIG